MSTTVAFDPFADLLVAQDRRPDGVGPVNLRALSPFHRALLAIDGTVTTFIEAFTMEPVVVEVVSQEPRSLPVAHGWLEVVPGSRVVARQVELRGGSSGRLYAHASSLLVVHRLPTQVVEAIDRSPRGLGGAMRSCRMETRREVLWYGREREADGTEVLSRAYRVLFRDHPIMLINERFPYDDDLVPVHH